MRKRGSTLGSSSSIDLPGFKIGRLGKPSGLDGFLGMYVEDEDLSLLETGSVVFVGERQYTLRAIRPGKKGPQVAFEGVNDRESAETMRGQEVYVSSRRELDDDEYWPNDLIGLRVRPGGGRVVDIAHGVAQDRLVIERGGTRFEVPFVDELVPDVDLEGGFVEVVEIEGLSSPTDPP